MTIDTSGNHDDHVNSVPSVAPASRQRSRSRVDHTYRDFSCYLQEGGTTAKHKKSEKNFPANLHIMLSSPQFSHIITWMPHGRAWKILNKELLMSTAVPAFFVQRKFQSFTRQLNGWGFKRLHQTGADFGCYYHECFLRGIPQLTRLMSRVSSNRGKFLPDAEGEPDFYLIARLYPLPPSVVSFPHASSAAATTMVAPSAVPHTPSYEMTHWNKSQNPMVPLPQADSSTKLAAATKMMKPASSAYSYSNASNQQKDSSGTSPAAATTMVAPSAVPYTAPYEMTHWNNAQNLVAPLSQADSSANLAAATKMMKPASSAYRYSNASNQQKDSSGTSQEAATTMVVPSSIPYTTPYEMTHWNNAQNQVAPLPQADSSANLAAATKMTMPASSAYSYSNASNQQKDSSGTSQEIATTMVAPLSMPYTAPYEMTHWNNVQNPRMPLPQADYLSRSSATTMTPASTSMFHFSSDEIRGGTNRHMTLDQASLNPAPTAAMGPATAMMPASFGAPMSYQHSYQIENIDTTQNLTRPPRTNYDSSCQMPNHVESGYHPGTSVHSKQDFFSHVFNPSPSNSTPTSTLTHNNYHNQGVHNHHLTQVQHQPTYYPQKSTSSIAGQKEELDGSIEETPHDVNHTQEVSPDIHTEMWT